MFKQMSKAELLKLWEETMDSPFPVNRSAGSVLDSFYPIDDYVVLIKDGKPVAGIGYSKRDGFNIRGGGYSVEKGAYREVYQEADNVIPLPYIAGFSSSTVSPEEWAKMAQRKGWDTNPTDEQLGQYANNPTVKAFKEYYGENHPTGAAWGVKGLPLSKMWWNIIKSENPTDVLLGILKESLSVTIPHHIESMSFMNKRLGLPIDYRMIRNSFAQTWGNARQLVNMDAEWSRRFTGDGYSLDDVDWNRVTKEIMTMYDNILDNM